MTITNENRKTDLVIDGSSLFTFSYTFDIIAEDTVTITFFDTDGVEVSVVMTRTTSSSPSANEFFVDKDNSQVKIGGTGTLQSQYGSNITQLLIVRTVDLTQEETFPTATNFQADAVETSLDKNTMGTQQINELLARCLIFPIQDTDVIVEIVAAAARAGKFLAFDSLGNPTVAVSTDGSVTVSAAMEPVVAAATLAVARDLLSVLTDVQIAALIAVLEALVIKKDGSVAFTGNQAMGTNKVTGMGDPTAAQDGATKVYTDNRVAGAVHTANDSEANAMLKAHSYLAQTSGFVNAFYASASSAEISGFVSSAADPADTAGNVIDKAKSESTNGNDSVMFFVPNGHFFEIVTSATPTIKWTPLIAGGAAPVDQD